MASDEQFTVDFSFHEFPGWEHATEAQKARAREIAERILQPARRVFGRIRVTSWLRTNSQAHMDGGAVDCVPDDEVGRQLERLPAEFRAASPATARLQASDLATRALKDWMATYLVPHRTIGEVIAERDHVHVTLWGVGGHGEVWVEPTEGDYQMGAALGMAVAALLALAMLALAFFAATRG